MTGLPISLMFTGWINPIRPPPGGGAPSCSGVLSTFNEQILVALTDKTIEAAQAILGEDLEFSRLDQVSDLQRLMGPVIAYKILLELSINASDPKEQRLAAAKILDSSKEDPEKISQRLRKSIFSDLTLDQLQAVVQTGITDPDKAVQRIRIMKDD